jgi:hypothetical protein
MTRFQAIASAGKKMIHTDIPGAMLGRYVDLASKAKKLGIKPLQLVPPTYDMVYPNFTKIHQDIKAALKKAS